MLKSIGQVYGKLRRQNRKDYVLLFISCFLSVLFIGAYGVVMQSDTVLQVLPPGGDSRKQLFFIFFLTILGCAIFVNYAAGLFFRYKSRECGILLALGAAKSQVRGLLFGDIALVSGLSALLGMALSAPLALGIWKLFQVTLVDSAEMQFRINPLGYGWGAAFALFTIALLFLSCFFFIRRTNLLDVINEQRKSEPIRDVRSWYGPAGLVMIVAGALLGFFSRTIWRLLFQHKDPFWTSGFYLLIPVGLYLFLLYAVIRGFRKKHSYKHMISRSTMKFQGRQTVRNMCLVALLTAGGLFAMFYSPTLVTGSLMNANTQPYDCIYRYRADEEMLTRQETQELADCHGETLLDYQELSLVTLATDGISTTLDAQNRWVETYYEQLTENTVLSASTWEQLTGEKVSLSPGTYRYTINEGSPYASDGVTLLTNPVTQETLPVTCEGRLLTHSVFAGYLVLGDEDYRQISQGLTPDWQETLVVFDLSDPESAYPFCRDLLNAIINHSSPACEVSTFYDRITKQRYESQGKAYFGDTDEIMQISYEERDSIQFVQGWKYFPDFAILNKVDMLQQMSVFLMTFLFIFLICLMAVFVILYTRSLTIGLANRQIYSDLKRLGAGRAYLLRSLKNQLSRILFLPTLLGAGLMYAFYLLLLYTNSGSLSADELASLAVNLALVAVVGLLLYGMYRLLLKQLCQMLQI